MSSANSAEHQRIERILDEVLPLLPELKTKYTDISVKKFTPENIPSTHTLQVIEEYKKSEFSTDFAYFIHCSKGEIGSILAISKENLACSDCEIKEMIVHEFAEGFLERDRLIAEKSRKLPLFGKLLYPIFRLRIDINAEKEMERRLGYKSTESIYDYFSDMRRVLRRPRKSLKYFIKMIKFYEETKERTYEE